MINHGKYCRSATVWEEITWISFRNFRDCLLRDHMHRRVKWVAYFKWHTSSDYCHTDYWVIITKKILYYLTLINTILLFIIRIIKLPWTICFSPPRLQETRSNFPDSGPAKQYSRGAVHAAFCKNAWASRQADAARKRVQLSADQSQNMVKAVFSKWARGRNQSSSGKVCLGWV